MKFEEEKGTDSVTAPNTIATDNNGSTDDVSRKLLCRKEYWGGF
jgi:hypothetical protein